MLIGLYGNPGVGKDTAANFLISSYGYKRYAFADPLKEACSAAYGIPIENFHSPELKEIPHQFWGKSPREIAQFVGTEMFRNLAGSDHWVRLLDLKLRIDFTTDSYVDAVITDVRFQNEADMIINRGGILVEITRPGKTNEVGLANHASNAGFDVSNYPITRRYLCANSSTIHMFQQNLSSILLFPRNL